jgi:hypothetical protein
MLTAYELDGGDIEYHLSSREGDEIVLVDLDPVSQKVAQAIVGEATTSYWGEYLEAGVVSKRVYLFQ